MSALFLTVASESERVVAYAPDSTAPDGMMPLVKQSLLAEAESRIAVLQAQVDAVRGLADSLIAKFSQGEDVWSDPADEAVVNTSQQFRAALGEQK